jgi:hypothetical protein
VTLPEGWSAIENERIWVSGRAYKLTARHGADQAEITALNLYEPAD